MASNDLIKWNSVIMDMGIHELRLSLTIQNFLDSFWEPQLSDILETPPMKCNRQCGNKWALQVYNDIKDPNEMNDIRVYLRLIEKPFDAEARVTASFYFYILGKDGNKLKITDPFDQEKGEALEQGIAGDFLITRSEITKNKDLYLVNGHLTIRCEGKEFLNQPHHTLKIENLPEFVSSNHYSELVKKVYQESICCDVTLKAGSSELQCHKNILAASSAYFKAMFQHDMKENRENVVDLSRDLNGEELKAMLDFIYLGSEKLPTLSTVASYQTMYRVSDMYEIGGLQKVCESLLIDQINSDNALDLLIFSSTFGAKRLKKAAASMIANGLDSD